jgi:hypothetical protein
MNKSTSGGSLNVMVQPTPTPIVNGTQTNFTVSFEQKGGRLVRPHTLTITKDGKRVFQASALGGGIIKGTSNIAHPNQPLHVTTGIVTSMHTRGDLDLYFTPQESVSIMPVWLKLSSSDFGS